MKLKSINDHMNTCTDCSFTAFFMYKDAANCPLCPKCNETDIKAFKELMSDLNDELESENGESIDSDEITELNF
jgi:hypothetical protein